MKIYFSKESNDLLFEYNILTRLENGVLVIDFEKLKRVLCSDNTKCFINYSMITRLGFGFRTSSIISGENLLLQISIEKMKFISCLRELENAYSVKTKLKL